MVERDSLHVFVEPKVQNMGRFRRRANLNTLIKQTLGNRDLNSVLESVDCTKPRANAQSVLPSFFGMTLLSMPLNPIAWIKAPLPTLEPPPLMQNNKSLRTFKEYLTTDISAGITGSTGLFTRM